MGDKAHSRYFYTKLTDGEKRAYDAILAAWLRYDTSVTFKKGADVNVGRVISSVFSDNPELFYVDMSRVSYTAAPFVTTVRASLRFDKERCAAMKAELYRRVDAFWASVPGGADKEKAAHDYLTAKVAYTMGDLDSGVHTAEGALLYGKAVCEGFARAFKLLLDRVGIPCIVVTGTAVNHTGVPENHAWNIVRIDGKNYNVDVTWNAEGIKKGRTPFYYNVPDHQLAKDHAWDRGAYPLCTDSRFFEAQFTPVSGMESLGECLWKAYVEGRRAVAMRFNRKFTSDAELAEAVKTAMARRGIRSRGFTLSYQRSTDCADLTFNF